MAVVLDASNVERTIINPFRDDEIPDSAEHFDGVIILGGAQSALDDESHPYFPKLVELIKDFSNREKHVLGICLGCQLVARAFGGENILDRELEVGFHPVVPTEAAAADPLMNLLSAAKQIFSWHTDTVVMPAGAVHLASSPMTPIQAFKVNPFVYGLQFHFEVDRHTLEPWLSEETAEYLDKKWPNWRPALAEQIENHEPAAVEFCDVLTARWLELVRQSIS